MKISDITTSQVERVMCDKIRVGLANRVGVDFLRDMKISVSPVSFLGDQLVQSWTQMIEHGWEEEREPEVRTEVTEKAEEYEPIPLTWWDHFKSRWFRGWLLRRFPIRTYALTKTIHVQNVIHEHCHIHKHNVCPHLPHSPEARHVSFLLNKSGDNTEVERMKERIVDFVRDYEFSSLHDTYRLESELFRLKDELEYAETSFRPRRAVF